MRVQFYIFPCVYFMVILAKRFLDLEYLVIYRYIYIVDRLCSKYKWPILSTIDKLIIFQDTLLKEVGSEVMLKALIVQSSYWK